MNFNFSKTFIDGLIVVDSICYEDNRGFYIKTYEKDLFSEYGINVGVQEVCGSVSKIGVLRGLHFQTKNSQSKLVRCAYGKLYDVAVDLRKDSKTFGKWFGMELTSDNKKMLFIPSGFAHGMLALSEITVLSYHSGEKYLPSFDSGIIWNDKTLNISWPLENIGGINNLILSDKDLKLNTFENYKKCLNLN